MPLLRRPDLWLPQPLGGSIYFLSAQPSLDSGLGWVDDGPQARALRLLRPALRALVRLLRGAGVERRRAALLAFAVTSLYAVSDELHQSTVAAATAHRSTG